MVTASLINVTFCLLTGLLSLQSMCHSFLVFLTVALLTDLDQRWIAGAIACDPQF